MNFLDTFKQRMKAIDAGKVTRNYAPAIKAPRYNLISVFDGVRKVVGFNLTRPDAESLERLARKRLRKLPQPDAGGSPFFELTELIAERIGD